MALSDNISNTFTLLGENFISNDITNFTLSSRGLLNSIADIAIGDFHNFNTRNYAYMQYHMLRNLVEKSITLHNIGEDAYTNGDPTNNMSNAQKPRYTDGNNYIDFSSKVKPLETSGIITTSVNIPVPQNHLYYTNNLYFDGDIVDNNGISTQSGFKDAANHDSPESGNVDLGNDAYVAANSILSKTKKLFRNNKIKSIISKFHTYGVEYNGQVRTEYGESHGRNLLKKDPQSSDEYIINGYENPYCRVWTHHHKYNLLARNMRANSGAYNYWGDNFEWTKAMSGFNTASSVYNPDDKNYLSIDEGHTEDDTEYGSGEKYDYAWRSKHNQQRRAQHTVLDTRTGLVRIAPKYLGGGDKNLHTKRTMFSIENLAWKDYDPYSFEQALSWEQRGPNGGRIMWFPPYELTFNETSKANWNSNEFIGRGEKLYTYTDTERDGTLSFLMVTDHPSSIDYASWWDGADDVNKEDDYLRYFAGCGNGWLGTAELGQPGPTSWTTDGAQPQVDANGNAIPSTTPMDDLVKKPTPLTDEYVNVPLQTIVPEPVDEGEETPPEREEIPEPSDIKVDFVVFYPNNYSGCYDTPQNNGTEKYTPKVDAIAYLLKGLGAQKMIDPNNNNNTIDLPLDERGYYTTPESGEPVSFYTDGIGYEMIYGTPVTPNDYKTKKNYLIGCKYNAKTYIQDKNKLWGYRTDHYQEKDGVYVIKPNDDNYKNTIDQKLTEAHKESYIDTVSYGLNSKVSDDTKKISFNDDSLYSFAEIACAVYSKNVNYHADMYEYLKGVVDNENNDNGKRREELENLFSSNNYYLKDVYIEGISNSHGYNRDNKTNKTRNDRLAENRGITIERWLKKVEKWKDVPNKVTFHPYGDESDGNKARPYDANDKNAKLYRCARCTMTFSNSKTTSLPNSNPEPEVVESDNGNIALATNTVTEYVGFDYVKTEDKGNGVEWKYYRKKKDVKLYEQVAKTDNNEKSDIPESLTLTEDQVLGIFDTYHGTMTDTPSKSANYNGDYKRDTERVNYKIGDIVKHDNNYYTARFNFIDVYDTYKWLPYIWDEITLNNIRSLIKAEYNFTDTMPSDGYSDGDIKYENGKFYILDGYKFDEDKWDKIRMYVEFGTYENGELVYVIEDDVFKLYRVQGDGSLQEVPLTPEQMPKSYNGVNDFQPNSICIHNGEYYMANSYVDRNDAYTWNEDISIAFTNNKGNFDCDAEYDFDDVVYYTNDEKYYVCSMSYDGAFDMYGGSLYNFIEFNLDDWALSNEYKFNWLELNLQRIAARALCYTEDKLRNIVFGNDCMFDVSDGYNDNMSEIWTEGDLDTSIESIDGSLVDFAYNRIVNECISFDKCEEYLEVVYDNQVGSTIDISESDFLDIITLYRLIDAAKLISTSDGNRATCNGNETAEEMEMKSKPINRDTSSDCPDGDMWVDTGDGVLYRLCDLNNNLKEVSGVPQSRSDAHNKLRYDQEYIFYREYIDTHPANWAKLIDKIKYFDPAYHSMTPEGFNARLTFLHQCTRQGNTKTMSDYGGKTANNLAFGRPPFCVLRIGDFYNQMIIIESVNIDYNVSEGIQWDLNTEGNGVQPMLAKVSLSIKFIGGGDITGPVRRLQNAMSFNYYANTSFYDNRADRPEYEHNVKTMGGAENNDILIDKSYAFQAKNYDPKNNTRNFKVK